MSAKILEFKPKVCVPAPSPISNEATWSGKAKCLACQHQWDMTRVPCGQLWFTCPECETDRGVFMAPLALPPTTLVYTCIPCGSDVFQLTTVGTFCLGCGRHQVFTGHPPRSA